MDEEIKKLLEDNLKLNQEIYGMVKSIKKHILWQNIWGFLKILVIVVPLVLGFIYLSPFLKGVFEQYQKLLGLQSSLNLESFGDQKSALELLGDSDTKIPAELERLLK